MINIHIIGVTQTSDLVGDALLAVQHASAVIGSERQLDIVKPHLMANSETSLHKLPKLAELKSLIEELSVERSDGEQHAIVVLASGDPLHYGIGRWFSQHFEQSQLRFYPAISSIQMACHRLAMSMQDVTVLSLHGRPLASLRTKLKNATKLLILTDKFSQPQALARECLETGFDESTITVLENLSYLHERIRTFSVAQLLDKAESFEPLHVSVIDVKGAGGILPEFPGIPDTSYITGVEAGKGMITKREVRLCILSLLQPANYDVIWDVGAGCGGVSIELSYWNDQVSVYAVECHEERLTHLLANQKRFGVVKNLHLIHGHAPECLTDLPVPNKVFIGGSGGDMNALLEIVWPRLPTGGLLVVSAVVEKTKRALQEFAMSVSSKAISDVEVVEVSVKRGQFKDTELDYTAKLPVEVFKFKKA
ncbi:MAG: precorrin-6y C5,15-methyltransferase (decarboxylating) subunit CbiE [Arenicella sp.]